MNFDFNLPGMDTKTLSDEGMWMDVIGPAGKPMTVTRPNPDAGKPLPHGDDEAPATITVPVRLKLLGPDADIYRALRAAAVRKRLRRNAAEAAAPGDTDPVASFVEDEEDAIEILASITVGWEGFLDGKSQDIPLTKEAAKALYRRFPLIRDQADNFTASRARFTKAS